MKIAVVGSGAIGGLLGSFLMQNCETVTFVDTWEEHVRALQTAGLIVAGPNGDKVLNVKATTSVIDAGTPDLIVFAVKAYNNEVAARDCLKIVGPDTIILTVQNGVGNIETIGGILGYHRIIAGTCAFGSTLVEPGRIKPTPAGSLSIGELDGRITPRLTKIAELFAKAGVEMHVCSNVDSLIWTKLMANVGINALATITKLTNGELLEYPETLSLQAAVVAEGAAVAKAKGISFLSEDILEYVRDVARSTYANKASMLQDVERGARTEVLAINGAIVAEGRKMGIPTPVNEALTYLVLTLEKKGNGKLRR
ncbi:MAG: ketopantoate reductase family protein [Negativicutes bacterium]